MKLHLTDKQIKVIISALDNYSRIGIGQLEDIANIIQELHPKLTQHDFISYDIKKSYLDPLKEKLWGFKYGASYGITNEKVHNNAKIAYDIQKTLQLYIAAKENHMKGSVWFDGNLLHLGSEPLATISE